MIPRFPIFKPLQLSDITEVNVHASRFDPYSDFNFVSMWNWNTGGHCAISTLHGNLVVRLADYLTDAPFFTFLGNNAVTETASALIRHSSSSGYGSSLRLVPEFAALSMDKPLMGAEMDMDGNDYVLSAGRLRSFEGSSLERRRTEINRFVRERPEHRVALLDLTDRAVVEGMIALFEKWAERKGTPDTFDLHEFKAFKRFLDSVQFLPDVHGIGVFSHDRLVAFANIELLPRRFAMAHFWKADISYSGLYPFLMREIGEFLTARGYEQLNFQQDLGLSGLRFSKKSYAPAAFLRKYSVVEHSARSMRPSLLSVPSVPDAFLASPANSFGVSLRPPSLSDALISLAREEEAQESERASIRRSGITVKRDGATQAADPVEGPPTSKVG